VEDCNGLGEHHVEEEVEDGNGVCEHHVEDGNGVD